MQKVEFHIKSDWTHILGLVLAMMVGLFLAQMLAIGIVALFSEIEVLSLLDISSEHHELASTRRWGLFVAGASSFGAFIAAPLLYSRYLGASSISVLVGQRPKGQVLLLGVLITLLFMLVNAAIVEWNKGLQLPEQLSGIEEWIRNREEDAERLIEYFTQMPTVWDFLATLCVVALIPALGEEFLFRGLLQRQLLERFGDAHVAIWGSALLFSFFHLQFYGFVPRMLLGALFGYMYLLSGNWWLAVTGHFVNNGLVVCTLYMEQNPDSVHKISNQELPPGWLSAAALILMLCLMYILYRMGKKTTSLSKWTEVYATKELHRAEIVDERLKSKGLEAVLMNEKDSTFTWGSYKIYVREKEAKEARRIVDEELDFV